MFILGDPATLEELASTMERRATEFESLGSRVLTVIDRSQAVWICAKADRFRANLSAHNRSTGQIREELASLSADLRRVAAEVRAELAVLAGLEHKVATLLEEAARLGRPSPLLSTPWASGALPPSGSPDWTQLARMLGI